MIPNKEWMSIRNRREPGFVDGVNNFIDYAFSHSANKEAIRCPCTKCRNAVYKGRSEVQYHLLKNGILENYSTWNFHGEGAGNTQDSTSTQELNEDHMLEDTLDDMDGLLNDIYGRRGEEEDFGMDTEEVAEEPNQDAAAFYRLLQEAKEKLYPNCSGSTPPLRPELTEEVAVHETGQGGTSKGHVGSRGIYKGIDLDKKTKSKKEKFPIYFMPGKKHFRPVGPNERSLNMWLAFCVRSVIGAPIHDYLTILPQYSDQLWSMATDYFQVSPDSPPKLKKIEDLNNTPPPEPLEVKKYKFREHCFNEMRASYRKYRSRLHDKYKKYETDEERMEHIPEGLSAEDWLQMLQLFASPEFKALSLKNANNRSNQKVIACTGPTPFAQTEYDMIDEETGKLPPASEVWMAQHSTLNANNERKWVDSSSENYYHEIRRTEEEVMPVDETVNDNEDVLRVVFGARSGYVRGKGTGYKSTTKGMNTNNQNGKIEQLEAQVGDLTARLADQAKHNLALTQRFEKFMEMVENERHESSSRSGHMEDALTSEETDGEDYTRDECSNKARRAEKKRSAPRKQVSNSRKKNRELREE